ncbi:MAG: hypothetical protein IPJ26_05680 [Bacteroidetes bacterium]|nr:hypothetical protein [Bacteroidota bacterium]
MPLFFNSLLTTGARIWVWHLTETEEALKKFISEDEFIHISSKYQHPQRKLQKIATGILLHHLGEGQLVSLQYNEEGKPFLRKSQVIFLFLIQKISLGYFIIPLYLLG